MVSIQSGNKISPAMVVIIVILAIVVFISGLIHLLVRFILKQRSSSSSSSSSSRSNFESNNGNLAISFSGSGVFQRQLQHLFNLHDSGLDQAFIDALPVFLYKDLVGLDEEPYDCPVCLSELSEQDKLRLLPLCGHAFHIHCIDTWLLSNSTCPVCRGTLLVEGFSLDNPCFEFDDHSRAEEDGVLRNVGLNVPKPAETENNNSIITKTRVFSVRLGKFKNVNEEGKVTDIELGESSSNNSNLDGRRCFSLGSYRYVLADTELQVSLCPDDAYKINTIDENPPNGGGDDAQGKKINIGSKGESFSVSKVWQWSTKKGKFGNHNHVSDFSYPFSGGGIQSSIR